ncbi:MAG: transposase, partial [Sulfuricella sp.]|nr:transposase [Sulfuricella sp.]
MKYSGIDLHSNNSVVTVTDDNDRVLAEKRLPNDLAKIVGFLLPWREELVGVVVESTYNWYWLVDGLQAAGFLVKLANTGAIRKYDGLKHSGDEADARQLAHLAGTIDELDHLQIVLDKYAGYFTPDTRVVLYVVNIGEPMQVEVEGVN